MAGKLFDRIRAAVESERFVFTVHARRRLEARHIENWQLVASLPKAELVEERRSDDPNPSIVVRQLLADGTEVEAVWSYLRWNRTAQLVTAYLPGHWDEP